MYYFEFFLGMTSLQIWVFLILEIREDFTRSTLAPLIFKKIDWFFTRIDLLEDVPMTKVSLGFYILICFYSHRRPLPFYFIKIKQNLHPLKVFKGAFFLFFPSGKTFVGALNRDE